MTADQSIDATETADINVNGIPPVASTIMNDDGTPVVNGTAIVHREPLARQ